MYLGEKFRYKNNHTLDGQINDNTYILFKITDEDYYFRRECDLNIDTNYQFKIPRIYRDGEDPVYEMSLFKKSCYSVDGREKKLRRILK